MIAAMLGNGAGNELDLHSLTDRSHMIEASRMCLEVRIIAINARHRAWTGCTHSRTCAIKSVESEVVSTVLITWT